MKTCKFLIILTLALCFGNCTKTNDDNYLKTNSTNSAGRLKASTMSGTGIFTVLSYNVAGLPQLLSSASDRETKTAIIGQKVSNYDIVNVQEDFNYHAILYANDTHPYRTATSGGAAIGSGLNTMSNFPFSDDIDRVKWTSCNGTDCLTPKGFTWIRMRIAEGVYIDVYNVHTNAGTTDADLSARRANINQLISYINTNSAGNAILIFGDTNDRYTRSGDNIRDLITGTGSLDSWVQLIKGGTPPAIGSGDLVCADTSIVLTDFNCEVVDKIFYRSNKLINLTPLVYTSEDAIFRTSQGYMLSDHRPAYTKFKYSLPSNLCFSDQFGGPHGTSYNDVNSLPASPKVSKIGIRSGSRVDQVNLTLSNGTTFTHGGTGGTTNSLTLGTGEYVTSVNLCSGKYNGTTRVFYIKFTTNNGRTLGGGTTTTTSVTYTAPTGWQIVGFHGRSGNALDKMGVIYAPVI
jgi:hypothetical protein